MEKSDVRFEGVHCTLSIQRPAPRVLVVVFTGKDVGEFSDRPFQEMEKDLAQGRVELFIDARAGQSASVDVSSEWAHWLQAKKPQFRHVSMLTRSRFVQLSAEFVRKFAQMGEVMRLYTDPAAFDGALASSVANAATA